MSKTFLVSGAGSGIGRAIALDLAEAGHGVILMGRNEASLKATHQDLPGEGHRLAVADIREATTIQAALQALAPTLHGVIANAGIGGDNTYGPNDRWSDIIETNLTGTYQLVEEALPFFASQTTGYRHIVIISSILARLGVPGYTAYCASKAGLLGLMRSWAAFLAEQKVLVNAICPGWVGTEMSTRGLEGFAEGSGKSYDEIYAEQMSDVPLGKMSEPEEVAHLVNFLVSNAQSSITGQTLDINNGALMPS